METLQKTITTLPSSPGIYMYRNTSGVVLYVGKAKNLKKRVQQYFRSKDALDPKTQLLIAQVVSIQTITTSSELDALLLEAKLIHEFAPKYNIILKDDKSPLYILLTFSEPLPHVYTVRKTDLPKKMKKTDSLFGPFQSAGTVRSILRALRHTVPYCTQKKRTGKPCFYWHIGLCHPCPSDIRTNKKEYRLHIFRLKSILSGNSSAVLKQLEQEMKIAADANQFEKAAMLRNNIQNLYAMLSKKYDPIVYVSSPDAAQTIQQEELLSLEQSLNLHHLKRIECFDISNIGGKYATGSMVVLTDGQIDTREYKRFKIRREHTPNDVAMMREVITRRMLHHEWPQADLIVIDGGKGQVNAVKDLVGSIPIIGLAKRFEDIILPQGDRYKIIRLNLSSGALRVVTRIRDEAHRFAIGYHRLLRKKSFGTI